MSRLVPETDLDAIAPFRVPDRLSADTVLRELVSRGVLVSVFGGRVVFCTVVEAFDADTIDLAIGRERRHDPFEGPQGPGPRLITFVAFMEDVKIQVTAHPRAVVLADGKLRLRLDRPEAMFRLQRRDGFRVRPLHGDPAFCHLRGPTGRYVRAPVVDVSVVGVAFALPEGLSEPTLGSVYQHCQLQLADCEIIPCDLVVSRTEAVPGGHRVCCRIAPRSRAAEQALQRTIMGIELRRA